MAGAIAAQFYAIWLLSHAGGHLGDAVQALQTQSRDTFSHRQTMGRDAPDLLRYRAAPAAQGLGTGRVGRFREQSSRPLLHVDCLGPQAARCGAAAVRSVDLGHSQSPALCVRGPNVQLIPSRVVPAQAPSIRSRPRRGNDIPSLLLTPGPAVLYIVTRSVEEGRVAGLVSVLGVCTGALFRAAAAALGLSPLLVS
jgi:hypothetical protein